MKYKIVVDSCCDLTEELLKNEHLVSVPLTLTVDGTDIIDDETFNQKDFLRRVAESHECPHSACPSPERYLKEYEEDGCDIYVVTLSSELSGSYNSAVLAKDMYGEHGGKNNIHVINSRSASAGELLIALKLIDLCESGMEFYKVVEVIENVTEEMNTYFVLESLETLRKNGRLTAVKAIIAKTLNIKPIMGSTPAGTIQKLEQARGINKALSRMTDLVSEQVADQSDKRIVISHCNNRERAELVADQIKDKCNFKEIVIADTRGVASMYASDGGIVIGA